MSELNFLNGMKNVEVEGHVGTWYSLDKRIFNFQGKNVECVLMEHEEYGEDAAWVIIDTNGKLIIQDCKNGWDELKEKLIDLKTLEEDYLKVIKYDEEVYQTELQNGRAKVFEILEERLKNNSTCDKDFYAYHFFKDNAYFLLENEHTISNS